MKAIEHYGSGSNLARDIADQTKTKLEEQQARGASKWIVKDGKGWWALWPDHWPTGPSRYRAYYAINIPNPRADGVEEVKLSLAFDPPVGTPVRIKFDQLARTRALKREPISIRANPQAKGEFQRAVEEGVAKLSELVSTTVDLMEMAYRESYPNEFPT